ncbi:MAG: O-antigen ligase family protein [Planctomycetes bacterium]|nr:O-antigen ligase family protein [Planctomycetota bacterium]
MALSLPELAPSAERRKPLPIAILTILCCMVAVWCIFSAELIGSKPQYFPMILSGVLLGFISLFEIRVGLAVLLLAIGLSPELEFMGISNFRYEDMIFPILLLVWITQQTLTRQGFAETNLKMPLLAIIFLSLLSTLNNKIYGQLDLQTSVLRFGKSVEYYFIFLIVLNSLRGIRDIRVFGILMIICSALVGLYGLVQYSTQAGGPSYRVSGPPGETANILGGYYVFHMCLATGLLTRVRAGARLLLFSYLALMAIPFVQTLSRTSYVALFCAFAIIWGLSRSRAISGIMLIIATVVLLSPAHVGERVLSVFGIFGGDEPTSWEARVRGWQLLLGYALHAPLLGQGVGHSPLGAVDNEYVLQINELGILGLIAFLMLVTRCLKTSYRLQKEEGQDDVVSGLALGYFGGCAALLVHSIGATTFTTIRTTEPFFFATGLIYVYWNHVNQRKNALDPQVAALPGRPAALAAPRAAPLIGRLATPPRGAESP